MLFGDNMAITYGPKTFSENSVLIFLAAAAAFLLCLYSFTRRKSISRAVCAFFFTLSAYKVAAIIFLPLLTDIGIPAPGMTGTWTAAQGIQFDLWSQLSALEYYAEYCLPHLIWFFGFSLFGGALFPKIFNKPLRFITLGIALILIYVGFNSLQNNIAEYPIEMVSAIALYAASLGYILGAIPHVVISVVKRRSGK